MEQERRIALFGHKSFYSADADAIRAEFDQTLVFPMLKVVGLDGQMAAGYSVLANIIRKRVSEIILEDDALDLLIRSTGGVLRDVFDALQRVSSFRNIQERPINRQDIRNALDRLSVDRGTQIGWPSDGEGKRPAPTDLYERLSEIAKAQADLKRVLPTNESAIEVLLRSEAFIEYNDVLSPCFKRPKPVDVSPYEKSPTWLEERQGHRVGGD